MGKAFLTVATQNHHRRLVPLVTPVRLVLFLAGQVADRAGMALRPDIAVLAVDLAAQVVGLEDLAGTSGLAAVATAWPIGRYKSLMFHCGCMTAPWSIT